MSLRQDFVDNPLRDIFDDSTFSVRFFPIRPTAGGCYAKVHLITYSTPKTCASGFPSAICSILRIVRIITATPCYMVIPASEKCFVKNRKSYVKCITLCNFDLYRCRIHWVACYIHHRGVII